MPFKVLFQVFLDRLIGSFHLSIVLRVPGEGEHFLDPKLLIKGKELVPELLFVVYNHSVGKTELADDVLP